MILIDTRHGNCGAGEDTIAFSPNQLPTYTVATGIAPVMSEVFCKDFGHKSAEVPKR
jgi:hypothetical protein